MKYFLRGQPTAHNGVVHEVVSRDKLLAAVRAGFVVLELHDTHGLEPDDLMDFRDLRIVRITTPNIRSFPPTIEKIILGCDIEWIPPLVEVERVTPETYSDEDDGVEFVSNKTRICTGEETSIFATESHLVFDNGQSYLSLTLENSTFEGPFPDVDRLYVVGSVPPLTGIPRLKVFGLTDAHYTEKLPVADAYVMERSTFRLDAADILVVDNAEVAGQVPRVKELFVQRGLGRSRRILEECGASAVSFMNVFDVAVMPVSPRKFSITLQCCSENFTLDLWDHDIKEMDLTLHAYSGVLSLKFPRVLEKLTIRGVRVGDAEFFLEMLDLDYFRVDRKWTTRHAISLREEVASCRMLRHLEIS